MARAEKDATIAELTERFSSANAAVLTEYRGLTVAQLTQLRSNLKEHATYQIVKNTLTKRAAQQAGVTAFEGELAGPSAVAFVTGDAVEVAKTLRDFARTNQALVIKGGVLDGGALSADDVRKLADLESREVLLGKLAGAMKAKLYQAAYLFQAPLAQAVRTVDALRLKLEEDAAPAEAEAGSTEAASTEAGSTDAGSTEAASTEAGSTETPAEAPAE
jgi:large subunit ribosomal protein L10